MNKQARDQFFADHYKEICKLCAKATSRLCRINGEDLRTDVRAYVMEGIVRGLAHMESVTNWHSYIYVYGYKSGIRGLHELTGKKRDRAKSSFVGVDLLFADPAYLEKLCKPQEDPNALHAAWFDKLVNRLERQCFFDRLRPSLERDVLGLLIAHHTRQSIVRRTRISQKSYANVARNLRAMYGNLTHNRPFDHIYASKLSPRPSA